MKNLAAIALCVALTGCTTTKTLYNNDNPADAQINQMRKQTYSVLRDNIAKSTPPMDMTEYKNIQFNIKQEKGVPLVQMQYQDFSKMMEMLHQLGTRIEVQKAYLGTTMDLLEKDIDNKQQSEKPADVGSTQ